MYSNTQKENNKEEDIVKQTVGLDSDKKEYKVFNKKQYSSKEEHIDNQYKSFYNEQIDSEKNQYRYKQNTLMRSKDTFDVGNNSHTDYNGETINSDFSVDAQMRYKNKETFGDNKHINEHRGFYEISIDDMPNRANLLKELYEEEDDDDDDDDDYFFSSKRATGKTGVKNANGDKSVGKIFKRRV